MANDQNSSRRRFLKAGVAAGAALGAGPVAHAATKAQYRQPVDPMTVVESFYGEHQAGIVTPQQSHVYVASLDLITEKRDDVIALLKAWTAASARMSKGDTAQPLPTDDKAAPDSGDILGIGAAGLTVTFGFGPGMFTKDGKDRYGIASKRPAALVDLPRFNGDQLIPQKTGGDIMIQACANDAQVAFHAVRQLSRMGYGVVAMRWGQAGFLSGPRGQTPRNLMGFKDGSNNPPVKDAALMNEFVWAKSDDAPWMDGGSYSVVRRIRITIEHWDTMERGFQEQVMGREKYSGAPIGKKNEFDPVDLKAVDADGNSVIPENSHVRLSNRDSNDGAQILRRSYSYNEGTNFYVERWPPWRQETEYDAGLIFVAFQGDPRKGFIPINDRLAKFDMMNQFTTHVGSGIFACPPGAQPGSYIGAGLFET